MDVISGDAIPKGQFSREQRLLRPEEFQRVFAQGCRTGCPGFVVLSLPNGGAGPRLGVAIARKHVRRAVDRNGFRRQIRESFRLHRALLGCRDYVVLAQGGLKQMIPSALRRELDSHWGVHIQRCAGSSSP